MHRHGTGPRWLGALAGASLVVGLSVGGLAAPGRASGEPGAELGASHVTVRITPATRKPRHLRVTQAVRLAHGRLGVRLNDGSRWDVRACQRRGSARCWWDARRRGDHRGRPFVRLPGRPTLTLTAIRPYQARPTPTPAPTPTPTPTTTVAPSETPAPTETPASSETPAPTETPTVAPAWDGYAAIGDSITYGTGAADPATATWPVRLGIPYLGRPGATLTFDGWWIALVTTFADDVASLDEHTIVVEIGTNDLGLQSGSAMLDGYQSLLDQADDLGVEVVLTTIPPRFSADPDDLDAWGVPISPKVRLINDWIRTQDHVDLDECLGNGAPDPDLLPEYDSGDHLHPGDTGYARIAECVADALTARAEG